MIGGGISNLYPNDKPELKDSVVIRRRLDSWRTEWQCRMLRVMSEGEAERKQQIERARSEAETEIVAKLSRIVEKGAREGGASHAALALRFIDSLGEMVSTTNGQWPLPPDVEATLKQLRGEIQSGGR